MSIPGVGPLLVGQVAQDTAVSLCGRFVNLFQNRLAAGAALTVTSVVGIVAGVFCGVWLAQVSKPLIAKIFPKTLELPGRFPEKLPGYSRCKMAVVVSTWAAVFITLNVIVSKCLNLPFSRLASVGISVVGGAAGFVWLFKS